MCLWRLTIQILGEICINLVIEPSSNVIRMMADVCGKDLYDLKILTVINCIKSVSKKKPTKERILKYMTRNNLKLQEEVLQMKTSLVI